MAYDRAIIHEKGADAPTNFHLVEYAEQLGKSCMRLPGHAQSGPLADGPSSPRGRVSHPLSAAPASPIGADPAQLSEALQHAVITPADLALRQQVAAVVAAGRHPGALLSSAANGAVAAGSPTGSSGALPLSAATHSEPGSPDLASLLFECVCLEGESPTSVLPGAEAAPAAKAAVWQPDACLC